MRTAAFNAGAQMQSSPVWLVLARALHDADYRARVMSDPAQAAGDLGLSREEISFLTKFDADAYYSLYGGLILHEVLAYPLAGRFQIFPESVTPAAGSGIPIRLAPGLAFGNGSHATTRLCLEALERYLRPGGVVLDIGTGNGLQAIAAAKLGARHVLGLDTSRRAVVQARKNVVLNEVAETVTIRFGSLNHVDRWLCPGAVDVLIVNILTSVVGRFIRQGLSQWLSADGILIASGIRTEELADLVDLLPTGDLEFSEARRDGMWAALLARKSR